MAIAKNKNAGLLLALYLITAGAVPASATGSKSTQLSTNAIYAIAQFPSAT